MSDVHRVLFIGSKQSGLNCLKQMYALKKEALLGAMTLDDRKDCRSVYHQMKAFCQKKGINLSVVRTQKASESFINKLKPELCIVSGWYWIIPAKILKVVPKGFLGFHFSLLPQYRGSAPVVWALIHGEKTVGVSLFSFTKGIDDGDIWQQKRVSVRSTDYIKDVLSKLEAKQVEILKKSYLGILKGQIRPRKQSKQKVSCFKRRTPEDGLINWQQPAKDIYNFIRAQSSPYPGAFTYFKKQKVAIWKAEVKSATGAGIPGAVIRKQRGTYVVCADKKLLLLKEVQVKRQRGAAGRILKAKDMQFESC